PLTSRCSTRGTPGGPAAPPPGAATPPARGRARPRRSCTRRPRPATGSATSRPSGRRGSWPARGTEEAPMAGKPRHVIVGGGTAGHNAITTIRQEERGREPSEIVLVSAERPAPRVVLP